MQKIQKNDVDDFISKQECCPDITFPRKVRRAMLTRQRKKQ